MALIQRFETSLSQDGSIMYLTDITGTYNATTNPGGYGAPNPLRSDLALLLSAKHKATTGDITVTVDAHDPEVVDIWSMANPGYECHYEFKVFPVAKKTGLETPVLNDFVYDFTGNVLQRWNGTSWATATVADLLANDKTHTTTDYPMLVKLMKALNNLNRLFILGCKTEAKADVQQYIEETFNMFHGTLALFAEGSYAQAQENIEKYQSRTDYLLALT